MKKIIAVIFLLMIAAYGCVKVENRTFENVRISGVSETKITLSNGITIFSTAPSINHFRKVLKDANTNNTPVTIRLERCAENDKKSYFAYLENVTQ